MFAVGVGIFWVGYTLTYWGWFRLGGPVDLLDLVVPGRPEPVRGPKDQFGPPSDPKGKGGGATGGGGGGGGGGGTPGW